jgi:hypothetical protein
MSAKNEVAVGYPNSLGGGGYRLWKILEVLASPSLTRTPPMFISFVLLLPYCGKYQYKMDVILSSVSSVTVRMLTIILVLLVTLINLFTGYRGLGHIAVTYGAQQIWSLTLESVMCEHCTGFQFVNASSTRQL